MTDNVLTSADVAEMIQVPEPTIAQWRKTGKGPAYFRAGRYARYLESDVMAWLREQRDANKAKIDERVARMAAGA